MENKKAQKSKISVNVPPE